MLSRLGPGGVGFHDQIFHQGCVLHCNSRKEDDGRIIYEVSLPVGAKFTPGSHMNHHVSVNILRGTGRFVLGGITHTYIPGSTFFVPVGMNHGFVEVDEETVFEKQAFYVESGTA
jgi:quercetin dioxygenase-like cupin family protein